MAGGVPAMLIGVLRAFRRHVGLPRSADRRPSRVSYIPLQLNLFVPTYPNNVQIHTRYADDVHAEKSSVKPQIAATTLTTHAAAVRYWATERDLQITLFTSDTQQSQLLTTVLQKQQLTATRTSPQTTRDDVRHTPVFHPPYPNISGESLSQT